jgi:hypothetical protein
VSSKTFANEMNIPKPPPGYWQQIQFGRSPERPPLPELQSDTPSEVIVKPQQAVVPSWLQNPALVAQIDDERKPANRVRVADALRNPHPLVRETKAKLERMRPNGYGIVNARLNSPTLDVRVSKPALHRALCIMDALIKALETRGYKIKVAKHDYVHTWIMVGTEELDVYLIEKSDRSDRPLTKEEQKKPPSAIYDRWIFTPSGKLTFVIDEHWSEVAKKRWGDKPGMLLEDQLNEIVIGLITAAEGRRLLTLKRQEADHQRKEAERRRQEQARLREAEQARRIELEQQVTCWRRSQDLGAFVQVCENALTKERGEIVPESSEAEWLQWAYGYAEQLDPLHNGYLEQIIPKRNAS